MTCAMPLIPIVVSVVVMVTPRTLGMRSSPCRTQHIRWVQERQRGSGASFSYVPEGGRAPECAWLGCRRPLPS